MDRFIWFYPRYRLQLMFFRCCRLALFTVVLALGVAPLPAGAGVRCSCPSISAEGEGNTSCSANESGGLCTIDYNAFAERETRAATLLNEEFSLNVTPAPDASTVNSLERAEARGELFEQVVLYLNVAAVSQLTRHDGTVDLDGISSIISIVEERRSAIEEAFSPRIRGSGISPDDAIFVDLEEVVISIGCVEVNTGSQWVMFKTFWSPVAASPGCRP